MGDNVAPPVMVLARQKSPGLAAILSFFWCGLGQIYNGEILKGVALMVVYTPCVWFGTASTFAGLLADIGANMADQQSAAGDFSLIFGLASLFLGGGLSLYGMANAYRRAAAINRQQLGAF
jgi:TM2 domain-containing membrane protein YozV